METAAEIRLRFAEQDLKKIRHKLRKLAAWAAENHSDSQFYVARPDFKPNEDWSGSEPGENGGEIHLIAQSETECLYGETTDNPDQADYLITSVGIAQGNDLMVEQVLDILFGCQSQWPDGYAQTQGWKI